jgi:hypothetical protein
MASDRDRRFGIRDVGVGTRQWLPLREPNGLARQHNGETTAFTWRALHVNVPTKR